jgi:hypothetical protein
MVRHGPELPQSDNLNNLQVGMVLLPESLNMDLVLDSLHQCYFPQGGYEPKQNLERIRLWARYFAPVGQEQGVLIS